MLTDHQRPVRGGKARDISFVNANDHVPRPLEALVVLRVAAVTTSITASVFSNSRTKERLLVAASLHPFKVLC